MVRTFESPEGEFIRVKNPGVNILQKGGFLHIRVHSGADVKITGRKDSEGNMPRCRIVVEEGGAAALFDIEVLSVSSKGDFRLSY